MPPKRRLDTTHVPSFQYKRRREIVATYLQERERAQSTTTGLETEGIEVEGVGLAHPSGGHSKLRHDQHQPSLQPEDGTRRTMRSQKAFPPATYIDATTRVASSYGSTEGWNHHLSNGSGSAYGAGPVASTIDEHVEPSKDTTSSPMNLMTRIFEEPSQRVKSEEVEVGSAPYSSHPKGEKTYWSGHNLAPSSEPMFHASTVIYQKAESVDAAQEGSLLPAVDAYAQLPVPYPLSSSSSLSGYISEYSSLAGALSPSRACCNTTPSSSTSSSSSSISVSLPSSQSASTSSSSLSSVAPPSLSASAASSPSPSSGQLSAHDSLGAASSISGDTAVQENSPWTGEGLSQPIPSSLALASLSTPNADVDCSPIPSMVNPNHSANSVTPDVLPQAPCKRELDLQTIEQRRVPHSTPSSSSSASVSASSSSQSASTSSLSSVGPSSSLAASACSSLSSSSGSLSVPVMDSLAAQMDERLPQPMGFSVALPSSSSWILDNDNRTSTSGKAASADVDCSPTPPMANRIVEASAYVPQQTPNKEDRDLQTTEKRDSTENTDLYSPSIPTNSEASQASASLPSTSPHPAIPAATSLSSNTSAATPGVPDAALLGWLVRNANSAVVRGLIGCDFLHGPRDSASTIQMLREAAVRHGAAAKDVEEYVKIVLMGAAELAALVNYDISYEDMDWLVANSP